MTEPTIGNTAWREHFTNNAADLLQVYRWAEGMTDEEFKHLLLVCFKRSRAAKVNTRTVGWALDAREAVKTCLREGRDPMTLVGGGR